MTAAETYLDVVRRTLDYLQRTQMRAVDQAADLAAHALLNGGAVFCAAIGHGVEGDFINRAGGLAAVQRFSVRFEVQDPVAECLQQRPRPSGQPEVDRELEAIRLAVRTSHLRPGDVMLIGSVSGRNRAPVELAIACREAGVRVIGLTSLEYTSRVTSLHPSGKKLSDVADVVIDNGAPMGDAAVSIPGYGIPLLPVSGWSMCVTGWLIWGRVLEIMAAAGRPAAVYLSVNREGGREFYERSRAEYHRRGY
jgi:uncharacterized phosphosugar-binding protein